MSYETELTRLSLTDPRVIVMTAENRAAIRSLPAVLGDRFVDVGICEQTMIGMAAGLALRGRRPVVHALAAFLTMRAYEFIRTDLGIPGLPVKLVGYVPGFLSEGNGPTHQALEDVAIMRGIPNLEVFCPADEDDLAAALPALLASDRPTYIRYTNRPAIVPHTVSDPHRAELVAEGRDVAIFTHGLLVAEALRARELLAAQGISARVVSVRSLKPLDEEAILTHGSATDLWVILEDHFKAGGLFTMVAELLVERGVRANVLPIALAERWFRPALLPDVLRTEGFTGEAIAARIVARLDRPHGNRVAHNARDPRIAASQSLWARSQDRGLIPAGTQTLAKGPGQYVDGIAPKYLARGRGARVWDVDGNEFLDMTMGVGPISLGYAYPAVDEAIRAQLDDGITFSLMHPLEVDVAELLRRTIPGAEAVRFSKTGCDVTTAAVRLARAFTGRERVVCCGYHGWHDWYISVTDRNRGIPRGTQELVSTIAYNDLASVLEAVDDETACVILEPMVFEEPRSGFLAELRRICSDRGALLVFDEMWTGFRLALGGAQARFGVVADLACFSKAMANGMPISALTGRADVMALLARDVFFFTTFGGEALSLAAARATIGELAARSVPEVLAARGRRLREGISALGFPFVSVPGMDARTMLAFDPTAGSPLEMKSYVQQELIRRGVLWTGFHNLSYSHTDSDLDYLLGCYAEILPSLAEKLTRGSVASALRGKPVEPVFRKTTQFHTKPRRAS